MKNDSRVNAIVVEVMTMGLTRIIVLRRTKKNPDSWRAVSTDTYGRVKSSYVTTDQVKETLMVSQQRRFLIKYLDKDNNPLLP